MSESKKTDWSKAPEWARKLGVNPYGEIAWLGDEGYSYLLGNGGVVPWSYETAYPYTAFKITESRPVGWNGEGLPPAGTVCVLRIKRDEPEGWWMDAEVMYSSKTAVVWRWEGRKEEFGAEWRDVEVRICRTPEQIAAEERDNARTEVLNAMTEGGKNTDPTEELWQFRLKVVGEMLDLGYRKQVAPEVVALLEKVLTLRGTLEQHNLLGEVEDALASARQVAP